MNMVEKVARAIASVEGVEFAWEEFAEEARAAIAAMRDNLPTEDFTLSEASAIRRYLDTALEPVDDDVDHDGDFIEDPPISSMP